MRWLSNRPGGGRGPQKYGGGGCKAEIATVDIRPVEREKAEKERRKQGLKTAGGVAYQSPIRRGQFLCPVGLGDAAPSFSRRAWGQW